MNSAEITMALYWRARPKADLVVPNVHFLMGEQDFLEITKAGFAYEYEIKVSRSDYLADFKKVVVESWQQCSRMEKGPVYKHKVLAGEQPREVEMSWGNRVLLKVPKRFFFVVPEGMVSPDEVPDYAGLIYAVRVPRVKTMMLRRIKQARSIDGAKKITPGEREQLLTSVYYRYWKHVEGKDSVLVGGDV